MLCERIKKKLILHSNSPHIFQAYKHYHGTIQENCTWHCNVEVFCCDDNHTDESK